MSVSIGINGKALTNSEYRGVFQDRFNRIVRNTFEVNDVLLFVTYQPKKLTLDYHEVTGHTHQLLKTFPYLEVLEQNFKYNNLYNYGEYVDGYHSHIIIKEGDYHRLSEQQLDGIDIVAKVVWDLERLINEYLSKQAGQTYHRLLPESHIPISSAETVSETINQVTKAILAKVLINECIVLFSAVSANEPLPKYFKSINKIDGANMFVDDT